MGANFGPSVWEGETQICVPKWRDDNLGPEERRSSRWMGSYVMRSLKVCTVSPNSLKGDYIEAGWACKGHGVYDSTRAYARLWTQ